MYQFIKCPNLPNGKVRLIGVGKVYLNKLQLDAYGVEVIGVEKRKELPIPTTSHIDMQVVHLYSRYFLSAPVDICKEDILYRDFFDELRCKANKLVDEKVELIYGNKGLEQIYPACAAYNVLLLGKLAVYNPKCIDFILENHILSLGYHPIHVKQGFARCSVCIVRENAVITADTGIAYALRKCDIDVLHIHPGYICLPGYDTGFLGGSSFKLSKDILAFTGHLREHPDRENIISFIRNHGVYSVTLSDHAIFDIGSAIPIIEEIE